MGLQFPTWVVNVSVLFELKCVNAIFDSLYQIIGLHHYWKFRYFIKILALDTGYSTRNSIIFLYLQLSWKKCTFKFPLERIEHVFSVTKHLTSPEIRARSEQVQKLPQDIFLTPKAEFIPLRYFAMTLFVH